MYTGDKRKKDDWENKVIKREGLKLSKKEKVVIKM